MMNRAGIALIVFCFAGLLTSEICTAALRHAYSAHGSPKYGINFQHFDYVNPKAPKGGTIKRSVIGTFNNLNPHTEKGIAALGVYRYTFDTLMEYSMDEPLSAYGLLAESLEVGPDYQWVAFNINPKARFHDGQPVTAEDVAFTFHLLMSKGSISYQNYYKQISGVKATSRYRVVFSAKTTGIRELPSILSELTILSKNQWSGSEDNFTSSGMTTLVGSGPYRIQSARPGHRLILERNPDYWAKDLPTRKGRYNFDRIVFDYYRDETASLEAFNAGHYDLRFEENIQFWETGYKRTDISSGKVVKLEIPIKGYYFQQSFNFNTRRDILKDWRVRRAIDIAFDFEAINYSLFYQSFKPTRSIFSGLPLATGPMPSEAELSIIRPYQNTVPDLFFKNLDELDQFTSGRERKTAALALLKKAGWQLEKGTLKNSRGEPFIISVMVITQDQERWALALKNNLKPLGITLNISIVDSSQYVARLRSHDYDLLLEGTHAMVSPGSEQTSLWSSETADKPDSYNLSGVKNPLVDKLIELLIKADSLKELRTISKTLDRVLAVHFYSTKGWYRPDVRIAYRNLRLRRPDHPPLSGVGLENWWLEKEVENLK